MAKKGSGGAPTVERMREKFPKFSKVALCMVNNPEYGIDFSEEAKRHLGIKKKKARKPEKKRLTVRVPDELYDAVKQMAGDGSYQELIERIIAEAIGGKNDSA